MSHTPKKLLLALPLALLVTACGPDYSANSYDAHSIGEVRRVEKGTIESYRWVKITGNNRIGTAAGVGVGLAAGSTVGRGADGIIGAIGGALLGGLIGSSIDKSVNNHHGFEYIIRTESGSLVTMVQADAQPLREDTPVLILFNGHRSRVVFDHNANINEPAG